MVTAYLFDQRHGEEVASWEDALGGLSDDEVLWLDLEEPSEEEAERINEALGLHVDARPGGAAVQPALDQQDGHLRVTAVAVSDDEGDPEREAIVVDCFVGANWVLTVHDARVAVIDDFRELAGGEGGIGRLDAPSFLSALLEWVVSSYLRAFDEIETTLEEFDVEALKSPSRHAEQQIAVLVEARRRVGRLRRALAPHREIFAALGHSEFDPISSDVSAGRFEELVTRVDTALATARDVRDGVASSFDVLIVRSEHKTNEIMKVLTLASILLLPGALIAGVAGMNVNLSGHDFTGSGLFWGVVAANISIALATLGFARAREWI